MQKRLFNSLCFSVVIWLSHSSIVGAQSFPLQVYVAEDGVAVRGGPGEAYYATLESNRGDELTAYRADGDWYAIRPPRGSFSLVSANAIADRGDGTGEVIRQGAASRIGSSIKDLQDTVHVRLEKGERVRILGSQMRSGVKWLRIEPPRGEFRWVHRSDVKLTPLEPRQVNSDTRQGAAVVMPLAHNGGDRYAAPPLAEEGDTGWEAQTQARPLPSPKTDGTLPPASPATTSPLDATDSKTAMPANSPALTSPPSPSANGSVSAIPPTGQTTTQPRESAGTAGGAPASEDCHIAVGPFGKSVSSPPVTDEEFARELFVMEIELGQIVADSPERWNLGGMEQKAQLLLSRAKTDTQKQSALALSARLSRFVAIRRQYELLPSTDAILASRGIRTPPPASNLPNTVAQSVSDASGNSNGDPRFDAMGTLRPVASKRTDAPKFALVNESGQIITFVTPAPDVNLQPYLGRVVGVNGTRGYMSEFNHRHVTAGRVMPVNDRMVR